MSFKKRFYKKKMTIEKPNKINNGNAEILKIRGRTM